MLKRFLRYLAIVTLLFTTTPLMAHAQFTSSNPGYFTMVKSLVVQNATAASPEARSSKTPTPPTPTPTLKITHFPLFPRRTPTPTPTVNMTPEPTADATDPMTYVISQINDYRSSLGLSAVKTSTQTCNFAAVRAKEITTDFSHTGFQQRINTKTLPYTSWTKVTENLAMTSSYKQVVTLWKNSPGHAANMRENTPYVCVRQNGNYFAYEGMKP